MWWSGEPNAAAEFLYVDDLADACIRLMKTYSSSELVNIGTAKTLPSPNSRAWSLRVDMPGEISFDPSRPTARRANCSDVSRLAKLGWRGKHFASKAESSCLSGFLRNPGRLVIVQSWAFDLSSSLDCFASLAMTADARAVCPSVPPSPGYQRLHEVASLAGEMWCASLRLDSFDTIRPHRCNRRAPSPRATVLTHAPARPPQDGEPAPNCQRDGVDAALRHLVDRGDDLASAACAS